MNKVGIVIVGGGLSGLYAAFLLERHGIGDYILLEAGARIGGRIESVPGGADRDRFDLGPTWFWPGYQRQLDQLINELKLARFAQYERGDMLVERATEAPPARSPGYADAPPSMRLLGGMAALTDALVQRLGVGKIALNHEVNAVRTTGEDVDVISQDAAGNTVTWRAQQVLLALPPRLAAYLEFTPALPIALVRQWAATPTWMAPHAKYVAVYREPFWRTLGLSGEGRSMRGPLGEIHDASIPEGKAALFGFFAVPALVRRGILREVLLSQCRRQLARMFGEQAAYPDTELFKDWAQAPFAATKADQDPPSFHASAPASAAASGPWQGRLTGIASEWSPQFPGYLAGAVEAADAGVRALLQSD